MKIRRLPGKADIEAIRNQILDFACVAHDFRAETDEFLPHGDWNGVFVVEFRGHPEEERLHCEAPSGEHFVRFWLNLTVDPKIWENEHDNILRLASRYDVAVNPTPVGGEGSKCIFRLRARAWIPSFSQRIFGLTLSNLMACKKAVLARFSDQPRGCACS